MGQPVKEVAEEFAVHFKAMMFKNYLVYKRSLKATVVQLVAPILFIILLFGLNHIDLQEEFDPPRVVTEKIRKCDASLTRSGSCYTLFYSYDGSGSINNNQNYGYINNSDADSIMQILAQQNDLIIRDSSLLTDSSPNNIIFKWVNQTYLDNFVIDNPNTTQAAIIFSPSTNGFSTYGTSYNILYNDTNIEYELMEGVQKAVDQAILTHFGRQQGKLSSNQVASYNLAVRKFPVRNPDGYDSIQSLGSLFFYCALMFQFSIFLYQLVNEKALQLRLGMRMVGLSDTAYWLSWQATFLIFVILYSLILIIFGYIFQMAFFLRTHFFVLFFNFFLFGLAMTQLAILISMFLTSTRAAINSALLISIVGVISQIVFAVQILVQLLYWPEKASPAYRILLQFYPPFNFSKIMSDISNLANEGAVKNLASGDRSLLFNWGDLYKARDFVQFEIPGASDNMWYLVMDSGIFTVLAWYFYNVLPSEKGLPPYFLFTHDYWSTWLPKKQPEIPQVEVNPNDDTDVQAEFVNAREDSKAALRILDLHKQYGKFGFIGRNVYAVKGVSLSVHSGTVFALLGHNGAGKTTTLSMLTGVIKPTKGDALMYGESLRHSLSDIQKMIGVCPQHNILWNELTAREHLQIFAELKRVPKEEQEKQIEERLHDVLLMEAADKKAGEYSGGMKRRLSVAISAMGSPSIIFMDEPTTGLDPMTRREIWGAVQKLKKNRVVILTTHSMEEADFLGDRIGIMAQGRLKCIGTSLHLKNKFGLGYRLNVTTFPEKQEFFKQEFAKIVPKAELVAETIGGNLAYGIQTNDLSQLIEFFSMIEGDNLLGVKDWGISQTTLEEVFLKVNHETASLVEQHK